MLLTVLFVGSVLLLFVATSWDVAPHRPGDAPTHRIDDPPPRDHVIGPGSDRHD